METFNNFFPIFPDFLLFIGEDPGFEYFDVPKLATTLRQFYCSVRQKPNTSDSGQEYGKSAYRCIRAGLQRHLSSPPYSRALDICKDRDFMSANQVFQGKMKSLKREGKDLVKHKDAIAESDMKTLYDSGVLGVDDPVSLQRKVFVELGLHFGRRGREGLRQLKKTSFTTKTDADGREYVTLTYSEFDKNHPDDQEKDQRMYSVPGDPMCPVSSFKKYLSKLHPLCLTFYQRPNARYQYKSWYVNAPLGVNTLNNMMKEISTAAKTSVTYTNHCLKATTGTVLKRAGVPVQDIMSVTGHKNPASLNSYCAGPDPGQRSNMSGILAQYGKNSSGYEKSKRPVTCTVTSATAAAASSSTAAVHVSEDLTNSQSQTLNVSVNSPPTSLVPSHIFGMTRFTGPVTININYPKEK